MAEKKNTKKGKTRRSVTAFCTHTEMWAVVEEEYFRERKPAYPIVMDDGSLRFGSFPEYVKNGGALFSDEASAYAAANTMTALGLEHEFREVEVKSSMPLG